MTVSCRRWALLLAAVAPLTVAAQAVPPPEPPPGAADGVLASARESVRAGARWLASGVDSWFGDRSFDDGGQVNNGRLDIGLVRRPPDDVKFSVRFNARFRLPNVEERGYFFIGRDNPREVVQDQPAAFSRQQRLLPESTDDTKFFAGLGLALRDRLDLRVGFRGGLKPYVQARYRKPWEWGPDDRLEFRQTLFWASDDKLGATTALSYEHAFSPLWSGRWLTAATITQASERLEVSSILGGYRRFGVQRLLSLEGIVTAAQKTGVGLTDYGLQLRWEQPVYQDWLLAELIVGRFFPRADSTVPRTPGWALGGIVKMRF